MFGYNETEDEYMADEYDMDDLEDEMNAEFDARDIDASDSEVEDFEQLVCLIIIIFFFGCFLVFWLMTLKLLSEQGCGYFCSSGSEWEGHSGYTVG